MNHKLAYLTRGTPVNAVNATKSLAFTGVVIHGETVTFDNPYKSGSDVYEFLATASQTPTVVGNIPVNIQAYAVKAHVHLTLAAQPTAGDTMTLGAKVYNFVAPANADADGEISIGTDLATAKLALVAGVNGTDGHNTAHPLVSAAAFISNDCEITALKGGTAGNSIASTETFTNVGNVFGTTTLAGGTDCTAANAVTALAAAITASDTQGIGGVDGAGDTIDLTADVAGTCGNYIDLSETLANGAFAGGATHMSGGVDGTVGKQEDLMIDNTYLYVCVLKNTTADKNWRRISVGSAF